MRIDKSNGGVIFCAPVLPPDVAAMAMALEAAGQLDCLVTRWCVTELETRYLQRFGLPHSWRNRPVSPVPRHRTCRLPIADVLQKLGRALARDKFQNLDNSFRVVDSAAASMVTPNTSAVLGREDACLLSFTRARDFHRPRIYQLPTAHFATVARLLQAEQNSFPEAFATTEVAADFSSERTQRKAAELSAATHILCPSSFVRRSLQAANVPEDKIMVIPFGIDADFASQACNERKPIFLYVGNISARKGVHRLIRVWKQLGAYRTHTLRLIGEWNLPTTFLKEFGKYFEHLPRLKHSALAQEYASAQAFVFNALADGFGHVVAEAMVCGTPVLASRNSGAPDLIADSSVGRLFDFGDDGALAQALDWALSSPRELLEMGRRGRIHALERSSNRFAAEFSRWITPIITANR